MTELEFIHRPGSSPSTAERQPAQTPAQTYWVSNAPPSPKYDGSSMLSREFPVVV
jgi:hypothetical protein